LSLAEKGDKDDRFSAIMAGKKNMQERERSLGRDSRLGHGHDALLLTQFLLFTLLSVLLKMLLEKQGCAPADLGAGQQRAGRRRRG
jgi:hypothetical protein